MKDSVSIIDKYKGAIIQIATPYSTGTGFYLRDFKCIVTNEHVVRNNKEVVIQSRLLPKVLAQVCYLDPKYDLAVIRIPDGHHLEGIAFDKSGAVPREGQRVIALGHPFGLKFSATQGIISSMLHHEDEIRYIQHDAALNPGNSGGPLMDEHGHLLGMNTFIIREGQNIGFALPAEYIKAALQDWQSSGTLRAVRCFSCNQIVQDRESKEQDKFCPFCGYEIQLISHIQNYEPFGVFKTVEEVLVQTGIDVTLARRGPAHWSFSWGSARIYVSYHENSGMILTEVYMCELAGNRIADLYDFLLKENAGFFGTTFSVKENIITLSLIVYDQFLESHFFALEMKELLHAADRYDDILIQKFGAVPVHLED